MKAVPRAAGAEPANPWRVAALTSIVMAAFAANSLLTRLALVEGTIDPAGFAAVRIGSGALMLALIVGRRWAAPRLLAVHWQAVVCLFGYVAFFSFAYLSLDAGTGALLLFGAVQLSMFAVALRKGERFDVLSWCGLTVAVAGVIWLLAPGLTAPDPPGALMMILAGIAWGGYSLVGRNAGPPLEATAVNFLWCAPLTLLLLPLYPGELVLTASGVALATASGALASALGYALWYTVLRDLSRARAATVQLSVPVLAAGGGVLFLAEPFTLRLAMASVAVLGGIGLVLSRRAPR